MLGIRLLNAKSYYQERKKNSAIGRVKTSPIEAFVIKKT